MTSRERLSSDTHECWGNMVLEDRLCWKQTGIQKIWHAILIFGYTETGTTSLLLDAVLHDAALFLIHDCRKAHQQASDSMVGSLRPQSNRAEASKTMLEGSFGFRFRA